MKFFNVENSVKFYDEILNGAAIVACYIMAGIVIGSEAWRIAPLRYLLATTIVGAFYSVGAAILIQITPRPADLGIPLIVFYWCYKMTNN